MIVHNMSIEVWRMSFVFNNLIEENIEEAYDILEDIGEEREPVSLFNLEVLEPDKEIGAVLATRIANMTSTVGDIVRHDNLRHDLMQYLSDVYSNTN